MQTEYSQRYQVCCWTRNFISLLLMWLNISKGTSCLKTGFWVMGMQSQNISKFSPKVDFEILHILESSILNLQVTWRVWCKNKCFHVKMALWIAKIPIFCTDSQISSAFFFKINFLPVCYDILNKFALSQERNVRFQKFLHQNWDERTAS